MARGKAGSRGKRAAFRFERCFYCRAYQFPEASLLARPEIGSQARFKKKKPKATYRYDSSLAPEMNWDGQNPAREHGEWLIACIEEAAKLKDADPPFTFKEPREFRSADGRIVASVGSLAEALRATHEERVWDHLAGDASAPFEAGENATIAVKVIDDRGNEMMVVRKLEK